MSPDPQMHEHMDNVLRLKVVSRNQQTTQTRLQLPLRAFALLDFQLIFSCPKQFFGGSSLSHHISIENMLCPFVGLLDASTSSTATATANQQPPVHRKAAARRGPRVLQSSSPVPRVVGARRSTSIAKVQPVGCL